MAPAIVCFPFVGDLVGGSHVSAAGLIRHLDHGRFAPLTLVQRPGGPVAALLQEHGIASHVAPVTPELAHGRRIGIGAAVALAAVVPRLAGFLRRQRVDIVHCNDGRTLATWGAAARLAGARLLWHHRGAPDAMGLRFLAPILANRVVAVSHYAAPRPGRYSAAGRTRVIHSPFDVEARHDRAAARRAVAALLDTIRPKTCIIGYSGTLIDRKRPLLFTDAIAELRRRAPDLDVQAILLGESFDGMADRVRSRAAEIGVAGRVHLLGHRTPGPFWLAGCDLLMVPAVGEPFGRTLIEAMIVGTAVVATASGGNVEAIEHGRTGLLVTPENAAALADACGELLRDDRQRDAIAGAAREAAVERFGEAAHAEAVMRLYAEMLPGKRQDGRGADTLKTCPVERNLPVPGGDLGLP